MVKAAVVALGTTLVLLAACGPEPKPVGPRPGEALSKSIPSVTDVLKVAYVLRVTSHVPTNPVTLSKLDTAGLDDVHVAAAIAEKIGRAVQIGAAEVTPDVRDLVLNIQADGQDRLGNPGNLQLMDLRFNVADLKAAKYDNLTAGDILNLADAVMPLSRPGARELIDYCSKPDQLRATEAFCHKAVATLEDQVSAGG